MSGTKGSNIRTARNRVVAMLVVCALEETKAFLRALVDSTYHSILNGALLKHTRPFFHDLIKGFELALVLVNHFGVYNVLFRL